MEECLQNSQQLPRNKRMVAYCCALAVLALLVSCDHVDLSNPRTACDIIENAKAFDDQRVHLRATFVTDGIENTYMIMEPGCKSNSVIRVSQDASRAQRSEDTLFWKLLAAYRLSKPGVHFGVSGRVEAKIAVDGKNDPEISVSIIEANDLRIVEIP